MSILIKHQKEQDVRYFNSEKWKCGASPTGSHIWTVVTNTKNNMSISKHICKYCKDEKLILRQAY